LQMLGYTRQDLEEGLVGGEQMTPLEYRVMDEWARVKLKESGVCPPMEKEYVRKDGSRLPVVVGVVFQEEPEKHLVCLVIDASDRRKAMDALRTAYDEMEMRVAQRTSDLAASNRELTREIVRRKRAESALQSLAITDALTGLYNRRGFTTLANQLLRQARRARHPFLLFLADLDGLKKINDSYGHLEGDQAINAAAAILKDTFRASDVIARIGGDEFAVAVLEDLAETGEQPLLERLHQKLNEFNAHAQKNYTLSLSFGTSESNPGDRSTIDAHLAQADTKLYQQKREKKLNIIKP
jgi:diguanylate cyclase (GGDEF)-like protein